MELLEKKKKLLVSARHASDFIWVTTLLIGFGLVSATGYIYYEYYIWLCFFSHLFLFIRCRHDNGLYLLLFFAISYIVFLLISELLNIPYHLYQEYQTESLITKVLCMQSISLRLMLLGLPKKNMELRPPYFPQKNNSLVFWGLIFGLGLMIPLAVIGKSTLITSAGGYGAESESSIFFEYCLPFFICAWIYANTSSKKKILFMMMVVFLILPLLFGRRLPFIMVGLLLFHLFFIRHFTYKSLTPLLFGVFVLLSILAVLRVGSGVDVGGSVINVSEHGVMANNQGGVLVSAVSYIGLIDEGFFDLEFRLKSFLGFLTSPFLPSSQALPETFVNFSAMEFTPIPGNGGLPGVYLYIWGGALGVLIGSLLLNYFFRNVGKHRYISIFVLFMLVTFPRWYAYNMIILIKMGFWLMFLLVLTDVADRYIKKRI